MRTHEPDAYRLLGVPIHAEQAQIRERYLALSRLYHPDRAGGSPRATEAFQAIAGAYKSLSQREQREHVDRQLTLSDPWRMAQDPRAERAVDAVQDFLGRIARRRPALAHALRGRDLRVVVEISFAVATRGGIRDVDASWHGPCSGCGGSGSLALDREPVCHVCEGTGQLRAGVRREERACGFCVGRGLVVLQPCVDCEGAGTRAQQRRIAVDLPVRCRDGALLRVRNGGEPGQHGGPAGDLVVDVRVAADPWLRLDGDDVVCRLPLTLAQACLGATLDVPCLEGVERLHVPPDVQAGQELRVGGRGATRPRGGRGDLRYVIEIDVPTPLDLEARSALLGVISRLPGAAHRRVAAFAAFTATARGDGHR